MAADGPAGHCRRPAAGARGGQDTLRVSYPPLDTPHIFPRTRRPSVARLKASCPQMCLVFQGFILDGSGAGAGKFRADKRPISETTHGTEPPSPPFSRECFAERPAEGQRGVKRGHRKPQVSYVPFCPRRGHGVPCRWTPTIPPPWARRLRRQTAAMPGLPIGSHSSPAAASRRNGGTAYPLLRVKKEGPLPRRGN